MVVDELVSVRLAIERVRDLTLTKDDLRLYFTDGYLIFGKPVDGDPAKVGFRFTKELVSTQ